MHDLRPQYLLRQNQHFISRYYTLNIPRKMSSSILPPPVSNGDLNNSSASRIVEKFQVDSTYSSRSLAISEHNDDADIRKKYRPFILDTKSSTSDWTESLELSTVMKMAEQDLEKSGERVKVLVLFGSLRERSVVFCLCKILRGLRVQ